MSSEQYIRHRTVLRLPAPQNYAKVLNCYRLRRGRWGQGGWRGPQPWHRARTRPLDAAGATPRFRPSPASPHGRGLPSGERPSSILHQSTLSGHDGKGGRWRATTRRLVSGNRVRLSCVRQMPFRGGCRWPTWWRKVPIRERHCPPLPFVKYPRGLPSARTGASGLLSARTGASACERQPGADSPQGLPLEPCGQGRSLAAGQSLWMAGHQRDRGKRGTFRPRPGLSSALGKPAGPLDRPSTSGGKVLQVDPRSAERVEGTG